MGNTSQLVCNTSPPSLAASPTNWNPSGCRCITIIIFSRISYNYNRQSRVHNRWSRAEFVICIVKAGFTRRQCSHQDTAKRGSRRYPDAHRDGAAGTPYLSILFGLRLLYYCSARFLCGTAWYTKLFCPTQKACALGKYSKHRSYADILHAGTHR